MISISEQQFGLFMSLFRGRTDVYARRWEKEGKSGYSPAYDFDWDEFMAHKRRGGSMKDFENKKLIPLTREVIKKHLIGQHVVGMYPILSDNTSYFIAADFDGENWLKDSISFLQACEEFGLSAYLERSRSGNGGHVWIFFSEPYPCYKSRQIALELIRKAFHVSEFEKEVSFDRLFPNQDTLTGAGFGNLIALPLQGGSVTTGNAIFIDLETSKPFPDQWQFLATVKRHTITELDSIYQSLFADTKKASVNMPTGRGLGILVSNQIDLKRSEISSGLIHFLKGELNFLNTEYLTKRRLGKSIYNVQKYFKLIDETTDFISLPRGFLQTLIDFLKENKIPYTIRFNISHFEQTSYQSQIKLMPVQVFIVQIAMECDQGVIVAPSGSGKTIIGLELVARRQLPTLILVHRKQLLDQWIERAQTFLGIAKAHIGQYSGTKKKLGKQITVGLLQSLARKGDLSELKDKFGTIIIDECHHIPATTFREVIAQLNPKYIYGLTATPKRKHNDEKLIYVYIGDIIARMEASDIEPVSDLPHQPPEVLIHTTTLAVPFRFTTDHFQLLAKVVCFDTARNQMIAEDILNKISDGKRLLVLSERKEHLEILAMYLKGKCETIVISGDDSAPKRKSKLKQIEGGHYQVILSTDQFFGEGLDIRNISCLILAFPFSFEGKLVQYVGRLRNISEQKIIVDYRDAQIPFLEKQFKQRERYYKKLKAQIKFA
ncbi:MAG: DEAD/DEAH box helicase family protein [Parcubacteria group bacterium]|nr:DEAD/DEAH box helicase family protein [Parcubacteria group bacterium]